MCIRDRALTDAGMAPSNFGGADKGALPTGFYAISMGYIGVPTAIAFVDFIKSYDSIITAEDIVNSWKKIEKKIAKVSAEKILQVVEKIGNFCKDNELTTDQAKNLSAFAHAISGEQLLSLWNAVSTGKHKNVAKFHALIRERFMTVISQASELKK